MILILGGTTEGRKAVQVVESAGKPYYYSTVGNEQAIEAVHAIRLTGGMDEEKMAQFCREKKISLLVDAAHPFAIRLLGRLQRVSSRLRIPVVRLERQYPAHDKRLIWCTDYAAAIDRLRADRDLQPIGPDRRQDHCETASLLGADALLVPYPEPERVSFAG